MLHFPRWKIILVLLVCGFFMAMATPNILSKDERNQFANYLPSDGVNLGLDLQGGSHLLLELDFAVYYIERLHDLQAEVRTALREKGIGYRDLSIQEDAVRFTLRPETLNPDLDLSGLLHKIDPDVVVDADDDHFRIYYTEAKQKKMQSQLLDQSIEIVGRRINEMGTKEPIIQRQGDNRILLQVPGLGDPNELKAILGKTAKMTFHLVNEAVTLDQAQQGIIPPDTRLLYSDDPDEQLADGTSTRFPVYRDVALSGELLTNAGVSYDRGRPVVTFQFNTLGAQKFGDITSKHIGQRFAVVLDGKVITAPVIRSAILGGRGIIEGHFTVDTANRLALLLRAGALPAPLDIVEERTVGPSLGTDSIAAGKNAALVAMLCVMLYMLLSYGVLGLFADVALLANMVIIMGALSALQATLTLPGIAGIVLTFGMAVDANVLIYERIAEEMRKGKTVLASVDTGFRTAFKTILDSNLTTLIAAVILFSFGSGSVKGFAVTLAIGILASMFSAILMTRMMVVLWLKANKSRALPLA